MEITIAPYPDYEGYPFGTTSTFSLRKIFVSVHQRHLLFDGLAVARSRLDFGCGRGDDEWGAEAGAVAGAVGGSGSERDDAGGVLRGARDRILDVAALAAAATEGSGRVAARRA